MKVSEVSNNDAIACAQLIRALQVATYNGLKEKDMEAYLSAKKWLGELGLQMANQLPGPHKDVPKVETKPSDTTMRVKSMGPIGSPVGKKSTRKKK